MFKINKALAITVTVAASILMNAPKGVAQSWDGATNKQCSPKGHAVRVYTSVAEYGNRAVAPGYFGGEDLDHSGSITVAELTEYSLSFTGNSEVSAFHFGLEDIFVSDPTRVPSGQYVYGNSLFDTSDDISLPYRIFFAKPEENLFIEIRGSNDYSDDSALNEIIQYSSDDFSVVLGRTSSTQLPILRVVRVPKC